MKTLPKTFLIVLVISCVLAYSQSISAQDGSLFRNGGNAPVVNPDHTMLRPVSQITAPANNAPQPIPYAAAAPSPGQQQGVTLAGASWIYEAPPQIRVYKKNDIVTIRVDEISRVQAEGNSESRRNTLYDALLKDWLKFDGLDLKPAEQADGDPRVQGSVNQLYRADASLETRESITFNIAARIVDIRPNGDLVLEASKTIVVNENVFETSLSGVCRPTDIAVDNVVLSRDLLDLQIHKQERGRLRDGYKRGWVTRWFETLLPF